jgi:hypothetical protein
VVVAAAHGPDLDTEVAMAVVLEDDEVLGLNEWERAKRL